MAQWITIEEAAEKYGFEKEYVWILIEMKEITVCYERPHRRRKCSGLYKPEQTRAYINVY